VSLQEGKLPGKGCGGWGGLDAPQQRRGRVRGGERVRPHAPNRLAFRVESLVLREHRRDLGVLRRGTRIESDFRLV